MTTAKLDLDSKNLWSKKPIFILLGESSYALYMTHALFLGVFNGLIKHFVPTSIPNPFLGGVITIAFVWLAVAISIATYKWIEIPSRKTNINKFQQKKLLKRVTFKHI